MIWGTNVRILDPEIYIPPGSSNLKSKGGLAQAHTSLARARLLWGPDFVIVLSPLGNALSGLGKAQEPLLVQALVPGAADRGYADSLTVGLRGQGSRCFAQGLRQRIALRRIAKAVSA